MSRPETIEDLDPNTLRLQMATFQVNEFNTNPHLLNAYSAFLVAAEALGGTTEGSYGTLSVYRPKVGPEVEATLTEAQATWDRRQEIYEKWIAGEDLKYDYMRDFARQHADAEGLPHKVDAVAD